VYLYISKIKRFITYDISAFYGMAGNPWSIAFAKFLYPDITDYDKIAHSL